MKKKRIMIITLIIISLALIISLVIFMITKPIKIDDYSKYNTSIIISTGLENPISIDINSDGLSQIVSSNNINKKTYIIGKDLYYLDGNIFYRYRLDKTYKDIYGIIKNVKDIKKISDKDKLTTYFINLSVKETNLLLEAISFNKKTTHKASGKLETSNNRIISFILEIKDIEGYDTIKIDIKFKALNDDYTINTNILNGSNETIPGNRKKIIETDKNIYEIIK